MKKLRTLAICNLLIFLVHVALSYATNYKLLNSVDVGEVSDKYNSLFTPVGRTFAIWGVIYIALLGFCIYHLVSAYRQSMLHQSNIDLSRIGVWFILNNLFTIAWLLLWTNQQIDASLLMIALQLITLIIINLRLRIHDPQGNIGSKVFTQFPLSIYFGWITIASIANTAIYLVAIDWNGFDTGYSAITWTRLMIAVAVLIAVLVVLTRKNVFFGLVVIWALYGIVLKRKEINAEFFSDIILTAWTGMAVVAIVCLIQLVRNLSISKKTHHPDFPLAGHAAK